MAALPLTLLMLPLEIRRMFYDAVVDASHTLTIECRLSNSGHSVDDITYYTFVPTRSAMDPLGHGSSRRTLYRPPFHPL